MKALTEDLHMICTDHAHWGFWMAKQSTCIATENPFAHNDEHKVLRAKHKNRIGK